MENKKSLKLQLAEANQEISELKTKIAKLEKLLKEMRDRCSPWDPPVAFVTKPIKPLSELTGEDVPRGADIYDFATDMQLEDPVD